MVSRMAQNLEDLLGLLLFRHLLKAVVMLKQQIKAKRWIMTGQEIQKVSQRDMGMLVNM